MGSFSVACQAMELHGMATVSGVRHLHRPLTIHVPPSGLVNSSAFHDLGHDVSSCLACRE